MSSPTTQSNSADEKKLVPSENPSVSWSAIVKLLVEDIDNSDTDSVLGALDRLFRLILEYNREEKGNVYRLTIFTTIISAVNAFPENEDIQEQGCRCLSASFAMSEGESSLACAILQEGGMDSTMEALARFPDSMRVQKSGFMALANNFSHAFVRSPFGGSTISSISSPPVPSFGASRSPPAGSFSPVPSFGASLSPPVIPSRNLEVVALLGRFVGENDGLVMIKKAMEAFPEEQALQRSAIILLENIVKQPEHKEAVKTGGLGRYVGAALDQFPENEKVAEAVRSYFSAASDP